MVLVRDTKDRETNAALLSLKRDIEKQFVYIKRYIQSIEDRQDDIDYLQNLYDRLQKIVARGNEAVAIINELMDKIANYNQGGQ